MQTVSAFSRPQTVPPVPKTVPKSTSLWILNSWRDLLLYVGTPLLLVPMFALAQARWSAQEIYIFVSAFGAMGHHLPGMIRAYGDRALFERFKWRFIIAPIFLLAVCVGFYFSDLKGIVLLVFLWGVWHGMMQTYGFCRIYDAKTGAFAATTRRLDFLTCGLWFAAAVVLSPARMTDVLETFYASGAPFVAPWIIRSAQQVLLGGAIAVALLSLGHFVWGWTRGKRANPVKMLLLTTSIAFWFYCNNGVANILAGIALFEVFHDVQYLSIVWIYNRNRVEKDSTIGGFMRFVFRRSGSLIGLYVGLVFAYGSIGYLNSHIGAETVKRLLTGVVAASGLLHFYYDGFIWKVREKSTRQSLGLAGGGEDVSLGGLVPGWVWHGAKWAVAFVLPLGALWFGQTHAATPEVDRSSWVVQALPTSTRAHYNYGAVLQKTGRTDQAIAEYEKVLARDPGYTKAHINLATGLMDRSKFDAAAAHFEEALRLEPNDATIRSSYARLLARIGRTDEATAQHQAALAAEPANATLQYQYGIFLHQLGRLDDAITQYEAALRLDPKLVDARCDYAAALAEKNRLDDAVAQYQEAARLQPNKADIRSNLGDIFLAQGKTTAAIAEYEQALKINPLLQHAEQSLQAARASDARFRPRSRN